MNAKKLLKSANSKGKLATAVVMYQQALSHYANENNWAVKSVYDEKGNEIPDVIMWIGDDDPTYAAQVSLGKRKADPEYWKRNKLSGSRTEATNATNKG